MSGTMSVDRNSKTDALPKARWAFIHLRAGVIMGYSHMHGHWIYLDNRWMECYPDKASVLEYDKDWFHNG